jgi:large conductance mechanosensitive channel
MRIGELIGLISFTGKSKHPGGDMSVQQEIRTFAKRGNFVDMVVGIIVGVSFCKMTSSLVTDVFMPPLGILLGGVDFSSLMMVLQEAKGGHPAVVLRYGLFINMCVDFILVAGALFFIIYMTNRMMKQDRSVPVHPDVKPCPLCLMEIPVNAKRCGHCTSILK